MRSKQGETENKKGKGIEKTDKKEKKRKTTAKEERREKTKRTRKKKQKKRKVRPQRRRRGAPIAREQQGEARRGPQVPQRLGH